MTTKLEGTYAPSRAIFLPKLQDQNSDLAILFSIVEKPYNYVFRDDLLPHGDDTVPVRGAISYKLWPVLTYSNGYWEVYRRFQEDFWVGGRGWEEGDMSGELSIEEFVIGEENFHEGSAGFTSIILKKTMKK